MPFTTVGSLTMHYETFGRGRKLVFVSGSGGDLRVRPGVMDTPLAAQFSTLAFDQRGLGQTAKPPGPYAMSEYADDAAGLMKRVGFDGADVIGVSFGGMVAQELALRHPRSVRKLVLCCTSSGGSGGASYPLHELAALPADERARRQLEISDLRRTREWQRDHPDDVQRLLEIAVEAARVGAGEADRERGARLQLEARRHHDTWVRLSQLDMPVLLCAGRYDGIAPLSNMQAMASRIPNATLNVYEGGHLFLIQDKSAYPDIARWLQNDAP